MAKDTAAAEKPATTGQAAVNGALTQNQNGFVKPSGTPTQSDGTNPHLKLAPIDAIYTVDEDLEPCCIRPVASLEEQILFEPTVMYRVYFDHLDAPEETEYEDCLPHANIFIQSDGQRCVEYDFLPTAIPLEVESIEVSVKTRAFLKAALQRWGGFKLIWGGPGTNDKYDTGANMLLYYDDQIAFVSLRRVGVPSQMTFAEVMADYLFLQSKDVQMGWLKRLFN